MVSVVHGERRPPWLAALLLTGVTGGAGVGAALVWLAVVRVQGVQSPYLARAMTACALRKATAGWVPECP